jgi:hypothetical protein
MMNWDMERVMEKLEQKGYVPSHPIKSKNCIPISRESFNEFKQNLTKKDEHDLLGQCILSIKKESADNVADFIYKSLYLLHTSYLYVLSETEHVPSFINQHLDKLSEWGEARDKKHGKSKGKPQLQVENYKTSIRDSVKKMLIDYPSSEKSNGVYANFTQHIDKTLATAKSKRLKWEDKASLCKENPTASIRYTLYQIGALQVEQSVLAVLEPEEQPTNEAVL